MPRCSMYGIIFNCMWVIFWDKCRELFQTWSIWDVNSLCPIFQRLLGSRGWCLIWVTSSTYPTSLWQYLGAEIPWGFLGDNVNHSGTIKLVKKSRRSPRSPNWILGFLDLGEYAHGSVHGKAFWGPCIHFLYLL